MAINSLITNAVGLAKENPLVTAAGVGVVTAGAVLGTAAIVGSKRSKARNSRKRSGRARDRRYISKQKHERAYQRRRKKQGKKTYGKKYKSRNGRRKGKIYYARKTGQPYILLSSGKAKFIKGKRRKS